MMPKFKPWQSTITMLLLGLLAITGVSARQVTQEQGPPRKPRPVPSGIRDLPDVSPAATEATAGIAAALPNVAGMNITECPQAGLPNNRPKPLDMREKDRVEEKSNQESDRRLNQDYSCFPQNETSIAINPRVQHNVVAGANDYRLGIGSSGVYASTDEGKTWYDSIIPFPSGPPPLTRGEGMIPSGGDPVIVFDRAGVVYYSQIGFYRGSDSGGVFVSRSTNGGFTWSRSCIPFDATPTNPNDDAAVCGGPGDPRQPGDGVVTFGADNDTVLNGSNPFDDKEWMTAGPRPSGVQPQCFTPITRTATTCNTAVVGVDRLYVTFTRFATIDPAAGTGNSQIFMSYSDDQGRSWSPARAVSGSAPFCIGATLGGNACDDNQFSVPTVNPTTGYLYIAYMNFNTADENQYLVVRSEDGGQTFEGPFFVSTIFDQNYPRAGTLPGTPFNRPDCTARGQQLSRQVLTNNCFRLNSAGNIVVDKRGGNFADDLYLVFSDNRNGTPASSNVDIFLFKSNDGGSTWFGPTRVNDDRSQLTGNRNDLNNTGDFGNDQWFPWVDINEKGHLNVVFHDRRLDRNSTESEWPESRQRPGNYLAWFWGAQCEVDDADSRDCVAGAAEMLEQPTAPVDPGPGPVPGQSQEDFPFDNFGISDVPFNLDYSFRAGIFMGDYNNVAVMGNNAYAAWTDSRNGRSSRNQPGRNPICEQSDVFVEQYDSNGLADGVNEAESTDRLFLATPCPGARE